MAFASTDFEFARTEPLLNHKKRLLAVLMATTLAACGGGGGGGGNSAPENTPGQDQQEPDEPLGGGSEEPSPDEEPPQEPEQPDGETPDEPEPEPEPIAASLTRLATVPLGAEVTGLFVTDNGDLFFNVQHPSSSNAQTNSRGKTFHTGTVGVVTGVNINELPREGLASVPVPETDQQRETVQMAYGDYQIIGQTGNTFGGALSQGLGTVLASDDTTVTVRSRNPDFNGFIATRADEGYLFTNWEDAPGGMSRLKLQRDAVSGLWSVDNSNVMMLDFGTWGTVANCFGSVSPWGTPLTSEEWGNMGDNTHEWNNPANSARQDSLAEYTDPNASNAGSANPFPNTYRYHYIVEITNPTGTNPTPVKRYAMGRFEHEISIVMPDQRTVYLSQDDTNGVLYKFVADSAADLSSGTLYAAKLTQDSGDADPATTGFDVEWVELAHGNQSTIESWIAQYDTIGYDDYVAGKSSYLTDADAIAWANGDTTFPAYDTTYALAVNNGYEGAETYGGAVTAGQPMDDRVAFLESRKAARAKGATAEWRKFEGIYVNQKRAEEAVKGTDLVPNETVDQAYVYFAIADMDNGMIDGGGDIRLSARVKDCGGVYRMPLEANYNVSRIEPVVMGSTYISGVDSSEQCDTDSLAQPDNVIVLDDGRIIIGEDGDQTNNALWLYDPGTQ